jgi:cytochrome b6-f complex iron-sulfur subunit
MERNEFIKSLGLGIALVCTGSCISGCGGSKSDDPTPAGTKVNIDIASQLMAVGSSANVSGVLFVRLATGNSTSSFLATQALCPHQSGALNWIGGNNLIQCSLHAAQFSTTGSVLKQPNDGGSTTALKIYSTSLSGTTLTATVS